MKKYLCLFLTALMLLSVLVACAEQGGGEDDTLQGIEVESDDPAAVALAEISVDWNQEDFTVLAREDFHYDEWYTEERTEVLEDAVYQRNLAFEEYCNLKLNIVPVPTAEMSAETKKDVQAGTGE